MKNFTRALAYYKDLRPGTLGTPAYKHLRLLLFWPIFGIVFLILERVSPHVWRAVTGNPLEYYEIASSIDAHIPFCEWFVIPYYFWFLFLIGMAVWGLLFDHVAFRNYMKFIILTYSATAVVYFFFPNMQSLRPSIAQGEGILLETVRRLYAFDTNTNVCPSIHVLGAVAVCLAGLHGKLGTRLGWRIFLILSTVLICLSTLFLKQHSVIDVLVALLFSALAYPLVYRMPKRSVKS